jgi:hypothetical protein
VKPAMAGSSGCTQDARSVTVSYAFKIVLGTYLHPGLTYINHPSFVTTPNEGHDLNLFVAFKTSLLTSLSAVHSRRAGDVATSRLLDGVDRDLPQACGCPGVEGICGDAKGARSTGSNDGCFVAVFEVTSADALKQR